MCVCVFFTKLERSIVALHSEYTRSLTIEMEKKKGFFVPFIGTLDVDLETLLSIRCVCVCVCVCGWCKGVCCPLGVT